MTSHAHPHAHGHDHGTTPLDPAIFGDENPCFGCGPTHPIGFHLRPVRDGDRVRVTFEPTARYEGPAGIMHGGLVTTLADELAAWAIIGLRERFGFTTSLEGKFLRPVRTGTVVEGVAHIVSDTTRTAKISVELSQGGHAAWRGTFDFVIPDAAGAERLMGRPLPEAWRKFARR